MTAGIAALVGAVFIGPRRRSSLPDLSASRSVIQPTGPSTTVNFYSSTALSSASAPSVSSPLVQVVSPIHPRQSRVSDESASSLTPVVVSYRRSGINTKGNIPLVVLGTALLWFGWFGFNAGSALAANYVAATAFLTTNTSAATAMVTWLVLDKVRSVESECESLPGVL